MLTEEEILRYSRMISVPGIGRGGIEKLKAASVLVIGAGALGSLCAMYLAGAGVGNITVADFDTIDISNLPRQLFFDTASAGKSKSQLLTERMRALNPNVRALALECLINRTNALEIFPNFDFIIDATDNPASKFMTDRICQKLKKHYVIGGVSGMQGQVMSSGPGFTTYSDIFPEEGVCSGITPCSLNGVIGSAAGVISCIQATETIKHLTATGEMLFDRLFTIDLSTMESRTIGVKFT